jgi:hypothetical protein
LYYITTQESICTTVEVCGSTYESNDNRYSKPIGLDTENTKSMPSKGGQRPSIYTGPNPCRLRPETLPTLTSGMLYDKAHQVTSSGCHRKPSRAIKGPVPGLWLDYLEIPGKLNQIRVVKPDEKANVGLAWEGVNEVKGEKSFC